MIRCLLILLVTALSVPLFAGDFADHVKDLGDSTRRATAFEALAKAGADAFDDLLDGLKQSPDEDGISAEEAAKRSIRRHECARLIGGLADTRASGPLLEGLKAQAVENPTHPWFGGTCAHSLGRIWSEKPASEGRSEVIGALVQFAQVATLSFEVRWGCLKGLAHLKAGGDVAAGILSDASAAPMLRSVAIEVIVETRHTGASDVLLDLWETQRLGPKGDDGARSGAQARDYTKPLGVQALFALSELGDKRAVDGMVDVATLNEFAAHATLRLHAIYQMKRDALRTESVAALIATFKDVAKPTQRSRAAQAVGEFGAAGVTAFLAVADDPAPEGQVEDYYKKQVDSHLASLRSDDALKAFVEAYGNVPADNKDLRTKIIEHLLNNRTSLKEAGAAVFRTAANDEALEAPKRARAIDAWAEARGKESFDDLSGWAKHADGAIRAQAVQNLGRSYIPFAKSRPLLEAALADKAEEFSKSREYALQGLQRSDDKTLLPLFVDALDPEKEPSAEVRNAGLRSIDSYRRTARIDDSDVFPAMKARLGDTDENVRATAVRVAATTAQRMGDKSEAVSIIERGLTDSGKEVRLQAYGQVNSDVSPDKVISAALLEDTREMKGHAITALSRLSSFGDDTARHRLIADLALESLEEPGRDLAARDLLGKLPATQSSYISDKIRSKIDGYVGGERKQYERVPNLVRVLISVKDLTYFNKVKELAQAPNPELRRACVAYIEAFGSRDDVEFLRTLRDLQDATADQVRPEIDAAIAKLSG